MRVANINITVSQDTWFKTYHDQVRELLLIMIAISEWFLCFVLLG